MSTTLIPSAPSPIRCTWNIALTVTRDVITRTYRLWQGHRQAHVLRRLSEEQLRDIGLKRADVAVSLASPFSQDPTSTLARMAEERRVSGEPFRIIRHRC